MSAADSDGDEDETDISRYPSPRKVALQLRPVLERLCTIDGLKAKQILAGAKLSKRSKKGNKEAPNQNDLVWNYDTLHILISSCPTRVPSKHWLGAIVLHLNILVKEKTKRLGSGASAP